MAEKGTEVLVRRCEMYELFIVRSRRPKGLGNAAKQELKYRAFNSLAFELLKREEERERCFFHHDLFNFLEKKRPHRWSARLAFKTLCPTRLKGGNFQRTRSMFNFLLN